MDHKKKLNSGANFIAYFDKPTYLPELKIITGNIAATILLQRILHLWNKDKKPFYKFKLPCKHEKYKIGGSWCEELSFTKKEFETAINKIGFRVSKQIKKDLISNKIIHDMPIEYWTDISRITYYTININNLNNLINKIKF